MLHIAKSLLPIKQLIVLERPEDDKFSKKLDNYIYKEGSFFRHYSHILNSSFTKLNTRVNHNNNHYDIINTIIDISDIFDIKYNDDIYKSYNSEEIIEITNQYIKEHISLPDNYSDFIGIEKDIKQYNESFQHDEEYSFYKGTKIFLETNITPQDAKISIIRMLFARDLFNFDAITLLREYLINSPMANTTLQIDTSNKNKCDNLLAIFRSDYKLLKEILYIFDESNNINIKQLFLYEPSLVINGALNTILFDYICALIYSRYIIAIYIFLI